MVVWVSIGIDLEEIFNELSKRKNISGIEEKKSRVLKNEKNIRSK